MKYLNNHIDCIKRFVDQWEVIDFCHICLFVSCDMTSFVRQSTSFVFLFLTDEN